MVTSPTSASVLPSLLSPLRGSPLLLSEQIVLACQIATWAFLASTDQLPSELMPDQDRWIGERLARVFGRLQQLNTLQGNGDAFLHVAENSAAYWNNNGDPGYQVPFELQAAPTDRLDLAFGVGYLDAKIVDPFIAEVQPEGRPAMSPKWNMNGRAQYVVRDAGTHHWFVRGDFSFKDDFYFDIYETPFLLEDSYWLFNAAIGVASADGAWRAEVWGRNLGDADYRAGGFTGGVAGPVQLYGEPRTYGVRFSYRFD